MLKTPEEFAKLLLDTYLGDHSAAMAGTFEAARAHQAVPASFFRDVFLLIHADQQYGPNGYSKERYVNQATRPLAK